MRRTFAVLLGALLVAAVPVGAQEHELVLSEDPHDDVAFARRLAATLPPIPTFRHQGVTYFVERVRNGALRDDGYSGYVRLVDLVGDEAPLEAKAAYVLRHLGAPPVQIEGAMGSLPVMELPEEGLVRAWSVHWVPVGIARSWSEPAGKGKQTYIPWTLGGSVFAFRVDGGRMFLLGAGLGLASGNSDPESEWAVIVHATLVPVAIRVWDRFYVAPTFGTAEISGVRVPDWPRPFSWKGFKTVGAQVSVCLSNCGD